MIESLPSAPLKTSDALHLTIAHAIPVSSIATADKVMGESGRVPLKRWHRTKTINSSKQHLQTGEFHLAIVGNSCLQLWGFLLCTKHLDPTIGHEIKKMRPCLIISPNEMNQHISTAIVAPMTTKGRKYPTRVPCSFQGKKAQIVLGQICTVDKKRLIKRLGVVSKNSQEKALQILQEMFAE